MTSTEPTAPRQSFGIDVGGSGVKGAVVDLETGQIVGERFRLETPQPATPEAVTRTVVEVVRHFGWTGPLGVTYPGVVVDGVVQTAANVDASWIGAHVAELMTAALDGQPVTVLNDADAAGLAEQPQAATARMGPMETAPKPEPAAGVADQTALERAALAALVASPEAAAEAAAEA
jgi:polyphosphate glucokinase